MEIKNKIAVVTGAASGIGLAVCQELIKRKVRAIAMVDKTDTVITSAQELNEGLNGTGPIAQAFVGNVTDGEFRKHVFDSLQQEWGIVSLCVPAAGITRDQLAVKINKDTGKAAIYPIQDFQLVVDINLTAPIYWAMEMISRVAENRCQRGMGKWKAGEGVQAAAIFIGSISSLGNKGQISYASTKAGLEGAAATLSKEAIFHGVRCGVIHPGFTDTPMVRALGEAYIEKYILPETQLGRLIRPTEIADAICFMISNSAVTGELWADAGWQPAAI